MLSIDIEYKIITEYLPIFDIYLIDKKYNIYFNKKVNKNIKIIQQFSIYTNIIPIIKNKFDNDWDSGRISAKYIKKYWIRTYPIDCIIGNVHNALNKPICKMVKDKLKEVLVIYIEKNKNENYVINQYVGILNVHQLLYVGW